MILVEDTSYPFLSVVACSGVVAACSEEAFACSAVALVCSAAALVCSVAGTIYRRLLFHHPLLPPRKILQVQRQAYYPPTTILHPLSQPQLSLCES